MLDRLPYCLLALWKGKEGVQCSAVQCGGSLTRSRVLFPGNIERNRFSNFFAGGGVKNKSEKTRQ